jgi:bile acid:Na+ symporter, BASS family
MKFVVTASIVLQVIAVGIQTNPANLFTCVRRPAWIVRIVFAMFVAVPALAVVLVKVSSASDRIKAALLLMSIAAAAPLLPRKLLKIGVDAGFAESLSAVTMLLAIPLVPATASVLGRLFGRDVVVSPAAVAGTLATTFLVPLVVGMVLKAALGHRAARLSDVCAMAGTSLLVVIVMLLLWLQRDSIFPLLGPGVAVISFFVLGSLLIGHLIGGPDPGERTALAVATVTHHPGLAILIATTSLSRVALVPAILVVVIGSAIVAVPYTSWRKRALGNRRPPVAAPAKAG